MGFWLFVSMIYCAVTVFALYMTYQEQRRQGRKSLAFNLMGYGLCTIWPILAAAMLVFTRFHPAPAYSIDSE